MVPFKAELEGYKVGKDSIQFPYNKPLPEALISKDSRSSRQRR